MKEEAISYFLSKLDTKHNGKTIKIVEKTYQLI